VTPRAAETWALFRLLRRARAIYGAEALGPFIISMARGPADVLTVLLLARWSDCDAGLDIVPLFETLSDLDGAAGVVDRLFTLPAYRTHLASCSNRQMIMIGYSDSNKDGGYAAATWALYRAQQEIAAVASAHKIPITFFHGRGGTVARGGGPIHRAILAQPDGTVQGRLRVTEQGENVASRYGDLDLAQRHLEQMVSAVLLVSCSRPAAGEAPRSAWPGIMEHISGAAQDAYRHLVHDTPGFLEFWRAATPIDEIGRLRIGSRPALRRGTTLRVADVRAIPWVFSWMQSRFNLPGWYGLGTGIEAAQVDGADELRTMYTEWPFFRNLVDNGQMSLLKADLDIAALYVGLVPDEALAFKIFRMVRDEYRRTHHALLSITGHPRLLHHQPRIERSVRMRNPYVDPLNYLQVEMLRRLRSQPDPASDEAEHLREIVVLTINGIAAGLRNTG
jgi:phosphoenolpyruvate carboxylase